MIRMPKQQVARARHCLTFAILALSTANLVQSATAPDITLTPATLDFKYLAGSALPTAPTLQIKSTGSALDYTLSVTGTVPNYNGQWLSLSSASGITPGTVKVYVNPYGLPSGNYSATIVVNAPKANTPIVNYTVTLEVGDAAPLLSVTTSDPGGTIAFAYTTGGAAPAHKNMSVMSIGGALSASITLAGGSWLKATPTGNIALVGLPSSVDVSVDPTGLIPGSYNAKIVVASTTASNKSITVPVSLNVSAGKPTVSSVWPAGALVNTASSVVVTITGANFFSTSSVSLGGKSLISTYISSTTVMATITSDLMTSAGKYLVTITTPTAASPSTDVVNFWVYPPGPQILAVANTASYNTNTVSPGGIITIYGINLGPDPTAPALVTVFPGTAPIPTSLAASALGTATSVSIDGNAAPILYTSPTQVSCIVPYALAAKVKNPAIQVNLSVTYGTKSPDQPVTVVASDPGIFTTDASGTGQGAILNINATSGDMTVNSSINPATKGSPIAIYVTGFGATNCVDGTAPNVCNPTATEANLISGIVTPKLPAAVTIDGVSATLLGTPQAPFNSVPGVLQINATVPASVKAGNTVAVVVSVGTANSQGKVTMAVK
jgi:uncharacterized protein (TIGR03437 family)